jgi:hypothetical protein
MVILRFDERPVLFTTKAYTLLIFAGIWALMQGITDIARAFAVRSLRNGSEGDGQCAAGWRGSASRS